jgi:hypothetical protein
MYYVRKRPELLVLGEAQLLGNFFAGLGYGLRVHIGG